MRAPKLDFVPGERLIMNCNYSNLIAGEIVIFKEYHYHPKHGEETLMVVDAENREKHEVKFSFEMYTWRADRININENKKENDVKYQWVDTENNKAKVLVRTENGEDHAMAYIIIKPLKARILNTPCLFPNIDGIKTYDWKVNILDCSAPREAYTNVSEAMEAIEKQLHIIGMNNANVENLMKVLLQLKNVEVFGKIEVVIKVEGLN